MATSIISTVASLGTKAYNNTPTPTKDKICNWLQEGINEFDAQTTKGEGVKRAATFQALGTVGTVAGGLVLGGVIAASVANPITLGVSLVVVGGLALGYGSYKTFKNTYKEIKSDTPEMGRVRTFFKALKPSFKRSIKNIFFGSVKLGLNLRTSWRQKFDTHVNNYQTNQNLKRKNLNEIKDKVVNLSKKIKNAEQTTEQLINKAKTTLNTLKLENLNDFTNNLTTEIKNKFNPLLENLEIATTEQEIKTQLNNIVDAFKPYQDISTGIQNIIKQLPPDGVNAIDKEALNEIKNIITSQIKIDTISQELIKQLKTGKENILQQFSQIFDGNNDLQTKFETAKTFIIGTKELTGNLQKQCKNTIQCCKDFIQKGDFEKAKNTLSFLAQIMGHEDPLRDFDLPNINMDTIISSINITKTSVDPTMQNMLTALENDILKGTLTLEMLEDQYSLIDNNIKNLITIYFEIKKQFEEATASVQTNFSQDSFESLINDSQKIQTLAKQVALLEIKNAIDGQYSKAINYLSTINSSINATIQNLKNLDNNFRGITLTALSELQVKLDQIRTDLASKFYDNIIILTEDNINEFKLNIKDEMEYNLEPFMKNLAHSMKIKALDKAEDFLSAKIREVL